MRVASKIAGAILIALTANCGDSRNAHSDRPAAPYTGEPPDDDPQLRNIMPKFFGLGRNICPAKKLYYHGFSGALDSGTRIEYIGDIQAGAISYHIYYYTHVGNHEVHRVVIMEGDCQYFGSYSVDDRPLGVVGMDIKFDAPESLGNVIHFSGISPPARVVVNGQMTTFGL